MTLQIAQQAVQETRYFFGNKRTGAIGEPVVRANAYKAGNKTDASLTQSTDSRAAIAFKTISDLRGNVPNPASPYEFGHFLARSFANSEDVVAGNCGEQAAYAVYHLKSVQHVPPTCIWYLRVVASSFSHCFAEISNGPPVAEVPKTEKWVVDPWANIACRASEYADFFKRKMAKWQTDNKRILCGTNWVEPGSPTITTEWVGLLSNYNGGVGCDFRGLSNPPSKNVASCGCIVM